MLKFESEYILYIYIRHEVIKMAIKDLKKIDKKLAEMNANAVTTNVSTNYVDQSEKVMEYMNFIAVYNKNLLNIK